MTAVKGQEKPVSSVLPQPILLVGAHRAGLALVTKGIGIAGRFAWRDTGLKQKLALKARPLLFPFKEGQETREILSLDNLLS